MSWGDELVKIRRLLRDHDAGIWTDDYLLNLYNNIQRDFQHRTSVLEDVAAQRVPGLYHLSYMHDWEYRFLPSKYSQFYQCLNRHDEAVFCHRWEPQVVTGITADVSDYGIHFTQPFEAFMGVTPGELIRMRFPANMRNLKFIAYDEEPIGLTTKKAVQTKDSSYLTTEGRPFSFYKTSDLDDSYILYPRPSTSFVDELSGEGVAFYAEDDTEDITTGTIAVRTGDVASDNIGVSVDIVGTVDNVFLVYDVTPTEITTTSDEGDYPEYLKKYIRYGVVGQAYGGNNDGRIQSLSSYWGARYEVGIDHTKRFVRNKRQDRDYRLTSGAQPRTRRSSLRLPSAYPEVHPR
jgi:hypothetical protein